MTALTVRRRFLNRIELVRIPIGFVACPEAKYTYIESFPDGERLTPEFYAPLFASGAARLYTIEYSTYAIVEIFSDKKLLLSYIWTDKSRRGGGLGKRMLKALVKALRREFPHSEALYLNADDPEYLEDPWAQRRIDWYIEAGAEIWSEPYAAADMRDPKTDVHYRLLAMPFRRWWQRHNKLNFPSAALSILLNEYRLPTQDRRVKAILPFVRADADEAILSTQRSNSAES